MREQNSPRPVQKENFPPPPSHRWSRVGLESDRESVPRARVCDTIDHQQNGLVTGALDVNLVLQVLFSKLSVVLSSRGYYALSYRSAGVLGLCAIKAFAGHHETLGGLVFCFDCWNGAASKFPRYRGITKQSGFSADSLLGVEHLCICASPESPGPL